MQQGVELGPRGIRINCIGPTVTDTPFLADTIKTYGEGFIDAFPKPLGRVSRPEEQARALIFLNSAAASYITGTVLWTDGGYMGGATTGLIKTG
jgi:NAD(P)-dependent dehydrogenase (short-subunit alcohol dehydrogenase family)